MENKINIAMEKDRMLTADEVILINEEVLYTLHLGDFLKMPDMDFGTILEVDPDVRALLN